ncbi:MAG: hypothetical protein FJW39_16215 [Acidobacteria bacterium]|nr:hypothetical protein [Acidobacteriota bacterium]
MWRFRPALHPCGTSSATRSDNAGVWTLSTRKSSGKPFGGFANVYALAAAINQFTGAVTVAFSAQDYITGPQTWLLNDTSEAVIPVGGSWITIDAFQGCAATGVKIAVAPVSGNPAWRQVYNRNTLAAAGAATVLAAGSRSPVASAWSRYVGPSNPLQLYTAYTYYIESIQVVYFITPPYLTCGRTISGSRDRRRRSTARSTQPTSSSNEVPWAGSTARLFHVPASLVPVSSVSNNMAVNPVGYHGKRAVARGA